MPHHSHYRWLFALTLVTASIGTIAVAQLLSGRGGTPPNETIQIQAGNILEILPVHSFPSATYSWILTQDRNFLEVGRNAFYSTRLINPGHLTLNVEVSTPTGPVLRRVFAIDVQPRQSPTPTAAALPTDSDNPSPTPLVRTVPEKRGDGLIIFPPHQALLLLTPLRDDVRPLHIDLHSQNDTNNDDILTNDIDNAGTFFQTSGTPLYLWFTDPLEQRDITLHASASDGTPLTQTLSVLPAEYAKKRGLFVSRVHIITEAQGPKSLLFSPKFEDAGSPALPLLFHWDFGDGTESIEEHPIHEYQTYGTYSVHLSIQSIETGLELASRTAAIPLTAPLIQDPDTNLPSPSLPPEEPSTPPRTSFLRTALITLGIAIGFTAIGFLAAWAVHIVKRLLQKRKGVPPSPPSPPPTSKDLGAGASDIGTNLLTSTKETTKSKESKEISTPKPPTVPTTSPTPNWLKKGPPPPPQKPATPTPAPPPPKPTAPIASAPTPPSPKPTSPVNAPQAPAPPKTPLAPPPKPAPPSPVPPATQKSPPSAPLKVPAPPVPISKPSASEPPPTAPPINVAPQPPPPPKLSTAPTVPTIPPIPTAPVTSPPKPQQPAPPPTSKEENGTENPTIAVVRAESIEQQKPGDPPKI